MYTFFSLLKSLLTSYSSILWNTFKKNAWDENHHFIFVLSSCNWHCGVVFITAEQLQSSKPLIVGTSGNAPPGNEAERLALVNNFAKAIHQVRKKVIFWQFSKVLNHSKGYHSEVNMIMVWILYYIKQNLTCVIDRVTLFNKYCVTFYKIYISVDDFWIRHDRNHLL